MGASGKIGRSPANRGFVIVAVLWILLALSSLAIIFSAYLAASARALAASDLSLQTEALVSAGVELTAYQLTLTDEKTRPQQGTFHFGLDDASVDVTFTSEAGRLDLNYASKEMLIGLFVVLGAAARTPPPNMPTGSSAGEPGPRRAARMWRRHATTRLAIRRGRGCSPMSTSWRWSPASPKRLSIACCRS
ncbi:NADPH-dependent 7-cyano-7-deazaguanine reductase QueF-like protein [Bradyrhizobium sp. USDA 4504]